MTRIRKTMPTPSEGTGPSVLDYVRSLCMEVNYEFGRPTAVKLIQEVGGADKLASVPPKNYDALIEACRAKLKPKPKSVKRENETDLIHMAHLAATIANTPWEHPLDIILRFFNINGTDKKTVLEAYHRFSQ